MELIFSPIKGSGSIFQSPVCKITPAGVSIIRPFGSRIEWVNVMYSILKGYKSIVPFNCTILRCLVISMCFSLNFSLISTAVNGVAYILHSSCGHRCAIAPIWSSWAWVKTTQKDLLSYQL